MHDHLYEIRHAFVGAGVLLSGLEVDLLALGIGGDFEFEGYLAVLVEGAVGAGDDFVLVDVFDSEGGAVFCDVLDIGGSGFGAVDGDGSGVWFALGYFEGCGLACVEVLDF